MKQRQEDIEALARRVAERIDESLRNGAPYPAIDGGGGFDRTNQYAREHWGPLRKFAGELLYGLLGRGLRDPFVDRQRD